MDTPSFEEIQRVGQYWAHVEALLCKHETIVFSYGEGPTCEKCGRPVEMLSDLQIEDMKERAEARGRGR